MFDDVQPVIGPYSAPKVACREFDPRSAEIAREVCGLISQHLSTVRTEHVGSTAVSGCGGSGIIDLVVSAPENELAAVTELLTRLGFQTSAESVFPHDRPPYRGGWMHNAEPFLLHVYVLPTAAAEIDSMRFFSSCLRSDAELARAYVGQKRSIIASGVTEPAEYCRQKGEFLKMVLG